MPDRKKAMHETSEFEFKRRHGHQVDDGQKFAEYVGTLQNGQLRTVYLALESLDVLKKWQTEQLHIKIKNSLTRKDTGFIFMVPQYT